MNWVVGSDMSASQCLLFDILYKSIVYQQINIIKFYLLKSIKKSEKRNYLPLNHSSFRRKKNCICSIYFVVWYGISVWKWRRREETQTHTRERYQLFVKNHAAIKLPEMKRNQIQSSKARHTPNGIYIWMRILNLHDNISFICIWLEYVGTTRQDNW